MSPCGPSPVARPSRRFRERRERWRTALVCLALWLAVWAVLACAAPARAEDWRAAERRCMAGCPPLVRYAGIETDAQYQARMRAQSAHDACQMACARKSAASVAPSFTPISKDARDYYRRNGWGAK
ncbi:MAG: hypothetical protein AB7D57_02985 [Desulfovibrionaceae bacterium]